MKNIIHILLFFLVTVPACKMKKADEQEIQKLLDRQVQLKESQEESVDRLLVIRDSLASQKEMLMERRNEKNQRIRKLRTSQEKLTEELKKEEESALTREKAELQQKISLYGDSIDRLILERAQLDGDIDSIEKNIGLYETQEGQVEKILKSGVGEIDQRIMKLENQKEQEIRNAKLLERRIMIADRKIEAYKMERQLYLDKRDELLRTRASESELSPYLKKIAEMDSVIRMEEESRIAIANELEQSRKWTSDVEKRIKDLQEKINQEYDRREIIDEFISSEKQRLQKEISVLEASREKLVNEQEIISDKLRGIREQIALLNKKSELIRNKDMSDILENQAAIEKTDAELADEEVRLMEESAELGLASPIKTSDSVGQELRSLLLLGDQLDSLRSSIQQEKKEVARTRAELSRKRAEAASQRARLGRNVATIAVILVLVGLGLLTLFYFLGKRAKKS